MVYKLAFFLSGHFPRLSESIGKRASLGWLKSFLGNFCLFIIFCCDGLLSITRDVQQSIFWERYTGRRYGWLSLA